MVEKTYDAVIVGAGPAGITAAAALKRSGFEIRLFEMSRPGGLLLHAGWVENFPGVRESMDGETLASAFLSKLEALGVEPVMEEVLGWEKAGELFSVTTAKAACRSAALILAAGTKPLIPDFSVSSGCGGTGRVTADYLEVRSRPPSSVIIVGGGDAAFDYALSLAARGWKVTIAYRALEPKALGLLVERAGRVPAISQAGSFTPSRIECATDAAVLYGMDSAGGEEKALEAGCILTATGRTPRDDLAGGIDMPGNLSGGIESVPGLFIAGDMRRSRSRQAVIAAGDGMASAMAAASYLQSRRASSTL
ncbi:MAG: NAD(P)/FAD-dependent oxidoreductase [Pseudomonadota bacterium]